MTLEEIIKRLFSSFPYSILVYLLWPIAIIQVGSFTVGTLAWLASFGLTALFVYWDTNYNQK